MNFDDFCCFFQCYSILAEKQRTKQIDYSSLSLSASLDNQYTLQGGIIVEWKKFRQEIPVCSAQWFEKYSNEALPFPNFSWKFQIIPTIFFPLNSNCTDLLDLRNIREQTKNFCSDFSLIE